jgi:hypothetical protein
VAKWDGYIAAELGWDCSIKERCDRSHKYANEYPQCQENSSSSGEDSSSSSGGKHDDDCIGVGNVCYSSSSPSDSDGACQIDGYCPLSSSSGSAIILLETRGCYGHLICRFRGVWTDTYVRVKSPSTSPPWSDAELQQTCRDGHYENFEKPSSGLYSSIDFLTTCYPYNYNTPLPESYCGTRCWVCTNEKKSYVSCDNL